MDLQAAFEDDAVLALVDGETVLNLPSISTDYSIGLAATVETAVEPGTHHVEIAMPARGLSAQTKVNVTGDVHLAVTFDDGRIELHPREEPYLYY